MGQSVAWFENHFQPENQTMPIFASTDIELAELLDIGTAGALIPEFVRAFTPMVTTATGEQTCESESERIGVGFC